MLAFFVEFFFIDKKILTLTKKKKRKKKEVFNYFINKIKNPEEQESLSFNFILNLNLKFIYPLIWWSNEIGECTDALWWKSEKASW